MDNAAETESLPRAAEAAPASEAQPDDSEAELRAKGEAFFATLETPDPVVLVPADIVNGELLGLLLTTTRRILVPALLDGEKEPLRVAVRPRASCRTCNGSVAFRYTPAKKKGEKESPKPSACPCVYAAVDRWKFMRLSPTQEQRFIDAMFAPSPFTDAPLAGVDLGEPGADRTVEVAVAVAPDGTPRIEDMRVVGAADRTGALSAQLGAIELRLAEAERAKVEALAPVEAAIAEQAAEYQEQEKRKGSLRIAVGLLRAEASGHRRSAAELRAAADAEDAHAAAAEHRALEVEEEKRQADQARDAVGQRGLDLLAQQDRIARWHDNRMRGDKKRAERLRAKLGRPS